MSSNDSIKQKRPRFTYFSVFQFNCKITKNSIYNKFCPKKIYLPKCQQYTMLLLKRGTRIAIKFTHFN